MTATVLARRTRGGVRYTLCELLEKLEAAWAITEADPCRAKAWPLAEVYRITGPLTLLEMSMLTGFPERTICRWNSAGAVPDRSSDALAVALGLHPANLWPGWFE